MRKANQVSSSAGRYRRIDVPWNHRWKGWMGATDEEYEEALDIICEGESFKSKIEGTFFFSNYGWKKRGLEILRILRVKHLKFRVSTNIGKVLRRNKFEVLCAERHTCYKYDHRKLGKKVRKHL